MTVLYIRVSSEGQNIDRQEQALKDWAIKTKGISKKIKRINSLKEIN